MLRALLALLAVFGLAACNPPYQQKNGVWHFEDVAMDLEPGEELVPLNKRFAKSQKRAFHRNTPIAGAEGRTFVALDENYAKDARRAYWAHTYREPIEYFLVPRSRVTPIRDARVAAFKALGEGYAGDGAQVWYRGTAFPVRSAATFAPLAYGYARDDVSGYYNRVEIAGSDGKSFRALDPSYAVDARQAYFSEVGSASEGSTIAIQGVDVGSFKEVGNLYAKDARTVFYRGQPLEGADAASFEAVSGDHEAPDAKDKNRSYKRGKPVAPA